MKTRFAVLPALFLLAGCAVQPVHAADAPGFFAGLLHGLVALPALAGSLLLPIRIYAYPNDGFGYDLGYCVGFSASILLAMLSLVPLVGAFLTRGDWHGSSER